MTRDEAKIILQACRPESGDEADPFFAEALALARQDAQLGEWWAAQQQFDLRVAARLDEVPIPPHLREAILATPKIVPFPVARLWSYGILAAAAALVLGLLVARELTPAPMDRATFTASVMPYIQDHPALDLTASQQAQIVAWLKDHHSPTGPLPPPMTSMPTVGCEQLAVHGHKVSLICFQVADGQFVHLFVVPHEALRDPPGPAPEYAQSGDWSTAAWTTDGISFVMATRAGPDTLKAML
jgi:hypothetical protein